MSLRRIAEKLSRGVVLRRRLPAAFHRLPIYVSPEAGGLRYWLRMSNVDPVLYKMAEELVKPGSVVWDIGANVGLFSFCAAALAGPSGCVLAIEPDIWLCHLISRSAQGLKNNDKTAPLSVLCAAISDTNSVGYLEIAERARASNHLTESQGAEQANSGRHRQPTATLSLDFILDFFPAPSVLKIDVEACETRVLAGSLKLLKTVRPVLWCEVSPENAQKVSSLLHGLDYELYNPTTGGPASRVPIKSANWHTLAIPKS